jgi:pimeloyl-ACP methyl ester carboxylesterase
VTYAVAVTRPAGDVTGVAVVLHGGRAESTATVRGNQLAVLRMRPFSRGLAAAGRGSGLAVARVRFTVRGWNGALRSPVADATRALDDLAARFPGVPVALVGHSMGGRTALYAARHDRVRAVVALAPWIEPHDPVAAVRGRRLLVLHGAADRVTSPAASAAYAREAAAFAESSSFVRVSGDGHAMLRRAALWHELTTGFVLAVLYGSEPSAAALAPVLDGALAGEPGLVV